MILELTIVGTGLVPLVGVAVGSAEGSVLGQDGKVLIRGDNNVLGLAVGANDDGLILELEEVGSDVVSILGVAVSSDGGLVPLVGEAVGSAEGSVLGQDDTQDGNVLTRGDNNILGLAVVGSDDGSILELAVVGSDDGSMLGLND